MWSPIGFTALGHLPVSSLERKIKSVKKEEVLLHESGAISFPLNMLQLLPLFSLFLKGTCFCQNVKIGKKLEAAGESHRVRNWALKACPALPFGRVIWSFDILIGFPCWVRATIKYFKDMVQWRVGWKDLYQEISLHLCNWKDIFQLHKYINGYLNLNRAGGFSQHSKPGTS